MKQFVSIINWEFIWSPQSLFWRYNIQFYKWMWLILRANVLSILPWNKRPTSELLLTMAAVEYRRQNVDGMDPGFEIAKPYL